MEGGARDAGERQRRVTARGEGRGDRHGESEDG